MRDGWMEDGWKMDGRWIWRMDGGRYMIYGQTIGLWTMDDQIWANNG